MTRSILSGIQVAARFTKHQAESLVEHLRAPPTEMDCATCALRIPLQANLFDWHCSVCKARNPYANSKCLACGAIQAYSGQGLTIKCSRCVTVQPIPMSNAKKHLDDAVKVTKGLLAKGTEIAKKEYEEQSSVPRIFHCEHCNVLLNNPNHEDRKEENVPRLLRVLCPQCSKETDIPSTVAADGLRSGKFLVSKGVHKAYYTAQSTPHADCPKCKIPVELPVIVVEHGDQKVQGNSSRVQCIGSGVYSVVCPTCSTEFAASIPVGQPKPQK
jgi:rubrerythrin